jgi:hypothetical protein
VKGFDGDPLRASALRKSLMGLLDVFPEHLAKPQHPTWFEPDEIVRNEQFDAILAAHRKDRLAFPIEALRATGAPHHGFDLLHPRRLAWFVPSLVASWLDGAPSRARDVFGADEIEEVVSGVVDDDWEWTSDEDAALADLFERALDAALATSLRPARAPAVPRPLEDGVRVWSLHSPSVPLDVLRVAKALRVPLGPLVDRWAADPSPLALEHLLEAVYDTVVPAKRLLAWESVADRLADGFFATFGERQERFAKAEKTVRRNIARRVDD